MPKLVNILRVRIVLRPDLRRETLCDHSPVGPIFSVGFWPLKHRININGSLDIWINGYISCIVAIIVIFVCQWMRVDGEPPVVGPLFLQRSTWRDGWGISEGHVHIWHHPIQWRYPILCGNHFRIVYCTFLFHKCRIWTQGTFCIRDCKHRYGLWNNKSRDLY